MKRKIFYLIVSKCRPICSERSIYIYPYARFHLFWLENGTTCTSLAFRVTCVIYSLVPPYKLDRARVENYGTYGQHLRELNWCQHWWTTSTLTHLQFYLLFWECLGEAGSQQDNSLLTLKDNIFTTVCVHLQIYFT